MDKKSDDFKEKIKSPQWRLVIVLVLTFSFVYLWSMFSGISNQANVDVSYSEFLHQLNFNNVDSVSIKKLHLTGEFKEPVDIFLEAQERTTTVTKFRTNLPSFQGEDILTVMRDKGVRITVQPEESLSPFWQFIVGLLPWVLIIGIWILIMRRAQGVQGGPGGLFSFGASKAKLHDVEKPSVTLHLKTLPEWKMQKKTFRKQYSF
jgi:cell division protease FtsH